MSIRQRHSGTAAALLCLSTIGGGAHAQQTPDKNAVQTIWKSDKLKEQDALEQTLAAAKQDIEFAKQLSDAHTELERHLRELTTKVEQSRESFAALLEARKKVTASLGGRWIGSIHCNSRYGYSKNDAQGAYTVTLNASSIASGGMLGTVDISGSTQGIDPFSVQGQFSLVFDSSDFVPPAKLSITFTGKDIDLSNLRGFIGQLQRDMTIVGVGIRSEDDCKMRLARA